MGKFIATSLGTLLYLLLPVFDVAFCGLILMGFFVYGFGIGQISLLSVLCAGLIAQAIFPGLPIEYPWRWSVLQKQDSPVKPKEQAKKARPPRNPYETMLN